MRDEILDLVAGIPTPGFFVTVDFVTISACVPGGIEEFVLQKLTLIRGGAAARKFVFKEGKWRLYFTFFPTDRVVEEKYALKNQVFKTHSRLE